MKGFIMTQTTKASLKAVKKATKAPSKVVYVLADAIKTALHTQVTLNCVQAESLAIKRVELFNVTADNLAVILEPASGKGVTPTPCTLEHWEAVFAFVEQDLINTRNILPSTAKVYISELYKLLKARGIEKPKAKTASAVSMSKARAELSAIPEAKLTEQLKQAASAGDFVQAAKLSKEVQRREKVRASEAKKAEASDTKALRDGLKKWVTEMDSEALAALLWVRNNWADLSEQYHKVK